MQDPMRQLARFALALAVVSTLPGLVTTAVAETPARTTHLFAVGVCPPWKTAPGDPALTAKWAASCRNDIQGVTDSLRRALSLDDANVTALIDEKATYETVVAGLTELAKKTQPTDRIVIYLNTHGGEIDASYRGYGVTDEVFALYSEKEPANFSQAVVNGPWMTARALRDRIDAIPAEEIVIILESCHSGASFKDFRYDLGGRYKPGWKGREAVIYSSGADQVANFVETQDGALFTKTFAEVLAAQGEKTLADALQKARAETHRDIRKRCLAGPYAGQTEIIRSDYLTYCTQQPDAFDPYGLLDDIKLQMRTESAVR
jgi:hypothetical protein